MAEQLPANFAIPQESAIASYSFTDIIDGRGYVAYYCSSYKNAAGTTMYQITTQSLPSNNIKISDVSGTNTTADFYTEQFNAPRTLQGDVLVNYCLELNNTGGSFTIKLYHYDGTTSTQIGSTFTRDLSASAQTEWNTAIIDVGTQNFAIGDQLRMELTYNSGAGTIEIGIDPLDRDASLLTPSTNTSETTTMQIYLPFKIEL